MVSAYIITILSLYSASLLGLVLLILRPYFVYLSLVFTASVYLEMSNKGHSTSSPYCSMQKITNTKGNGK